MLKYVREQLEKQGAFTESTVVEKDELDDNLFTEAAHVLDELSDLSTEGTGEETETRDFSAVSIPVEDDFEIDTVEFCMTDGRMTDIPGDATLQESYYKSLKSKNDFYQEAVNSVRQLPRESEENYLSRVSMKMDTLYNEYMDVIVQEGLFGFGEIKLSDESLIWTIHINFGKLKRDGSSEYNVSLPVLYDAPKKKILKKQLDCVKFWDYCRLTNAYDDLTSYANEHNIKLPKDGNIWDVFKPEKVCIPREPKDAYKMFVVIKNLTSGEDIWFSIESKIKKEKSKSAESTNDEKTLDLEVKHASAPNANFVDKKMFAESVAMLESVSRWNDNLYQEAINFGGAGDPPELAGSTPQPTQQQATPPAPATAPAPDQAQPAANGEQPPAPDVNVNIQNDDGNPPAPADGDTPPDDNPPSDPPTAENPNVNDVSDRIADGVNEELSKTSVGDDVDLSADVNEEPNFDPMGSGDTGTGDELNATAPDVDMNSAGPDGMDEMNTMDDAESQADMDFEKMTLNQLIEQAQEKAKDMTIDQLKAFLMDNQMPDGQTVGDTGDAGMAPEEDIQEGFFNYSRSNINGTLDTLLRKALGILNDDKMDLSTLLKEFRKNGKKLNKALNQAVKYETIYNEQEKKQMQLLNRCLCDIMSMVKDNSTPSNTQTAKRLIKAFCSQAKAVGTIIDAHKGNKPVGESAEIDIDDEEMFEEGFITALFNVRENLERKAQFVRDAVTGPIKRKAEADKLTVGFIKSEFAKRKESYTTGSTSQYGNTYGITREIERDNWRTDKLSALKSLGTKIERKDRKRAKFSAEELEWLNRTTELASELYDDINSVLKLDIDSEAEKLMNAIAKEASELHELCKKFKK